MNFPDSNSAVIAGHISESFNLWVKKILWSRKWQFAPVFLSGNPTDIRAWQAAVHGVTKV